MPAGGNPVQRTLDWVDVGWPLRPLAVALGISRQAVLDYYLRHGMPSGEVKLGDTTPTRPARPARRRKRRA